MTELEKLIKEKFGVNPSEFISVLKSNKSADGYILGGICEYKFWEYAKNNGYEIIRIKEKPQGGNNAKANEARGDFYIKKKTDETDLWYVVECKSLKSNAEDRAIVAKEVEGESRKRKIFDFLRKYSVKRNDSIRSNYNKNKKKYLKAKEKWESSHSGKIFPDFNWDPKNPGPGYPDLTTYWKTEKELKAWINQFEDKEFTSEAFYNGDAPIKLLQTHMPSIRKDEELNLDSTGPLKTDFNILCVDLFLRTREHKLIFANSLALNPQAGSPNHLQQNYNIFIWVRENKTDEFNPTEIEVRPPWYENLDDCIASYKTIPRKLDVTQVDNRYFGE